MNKVIKVALLALILLASLLLFGHAKGTIHPAKPCSVGSQPCIELVGPAGKIIARFNDFRFGAKGCVYYRSDINVTDWKQYCGGTLHWIGPDPSPKT